MRLAPSGRRGSAYVFVLGAATLIATAGILATVLQRQRLARQTDMTTTSTVDRAHASAVEYAQSLLAADPSGQAWRPFRRVVIETPSLLGDPGAVHEISVTDPVDDDLRTVNLTDPVRVTVESAIGAARRETQIDLAFTVEPLPALEYGFISGQTQGTGTVNVMGTSAAAASRPAMDASFSANAQSGVTPGAFRTVSSTMNDVAAVPVPAPPDELFAYYQSIGTVINVSSDVTYEDVLFSPVSNPANTGVNARGIYVINANNRRVNIRNSRVLGTLVILNPNALSQIGPKVSMSPASSDLPTLLVRGSIDFVLDNADLTESDEDRNFNPAGAPYMGTTDSDTSDAYPSRIRGLVYVSINASINKSSAFEGVLWVTGKTVTRGGRTLSVRWAPLTNPIPGFSRVSAMRVANEGVTRVAP